MRTMTGIELAGGAVTVGIELGAVARLGVLDRRSACGASLIVIGIIDPAVGTRREALVRQQARREFADAAPLHAEITGTPADERSQG
jgi:hypothetical protein